MMSVQFGADSGRSERIPDCIYIEKIFVFGLAHVATFANSLFTIRLIGLLDFLPKQSVG